MSPVVRQSVAMTPSTCDVGRGGSSPQAGRGAQGLGVRCGARGAEDVQVHEGCEEAARIGAGCGPGWPRVQARRHRTSRPWRALHDPRVQIRPPRPPRSAHEGRDLRTGVLGWPHLGRCHGGGALGAGGAQGRRPNLLQDAIPLRAVLSGSAESCGFRLLPSAALLILQQIENRWSRRSTKRSWPKQQS